MSLEQQAAEILGEPVEKTTIVSPRGQGKKMFTAGVVGGVAGQLIANKGMKTNATGLENLTGSHMILALGTTRLAFFSRKGLIKTGVNKLLAEIPRTDVTGFAVGGGVLTSEVDITLADGTVVSLETPKAQKGKTKAVAEAMGFA